MVLVLLSLRSFRVSGFICVLLSTVLFLLPGCATVQKAPLVYQNGAAVETLSTGASLSISKGEQGMGSNGYLLYHRPDRVRLVILSPFGTTLIEVFMDGELITIVNNEMKTAFIGRFDELPHKGQGEIWRQARWVMDTDLPGASLRIGSMSRVNRTGDTELVTYSEGLVVSKSLDNGDTVRYIDYELINGVPLATEIIMDSHDGGRFRIKMTDPEVNNPLASDAFVPRLSGFTFHPLASLQEQ